MKVNGEEMRLAAPQTALEFLKEQGFNPQRVALERNGEIIPRAAFADTMLQNQDTLEIVAFVGGG